MGNAFWLARCPSTTIRDFVAIAELKIVDAREHELVTRDHTGLVQQLERKRLQFCQPMMTVMPRESQLLPLKFDPGYCEMTSSSEIKKSGSFRSHQICKSDISNSSKIERVSEEVH